MPQLVYFWRGLKWIDCICLLSFVAERDIKGYSGSKLKLVNINRNPGYVYGVSYVTAFKES